MLCGKRPCSSDERLGPHTGCAAAWFTKCAPTLEMRRRFGMRLMRSWSKSLFKSSARIQTKFGFGAAAPAPAAAAARSSAAEVAAQRHILSDVDRHKSTSYQPASYAASARCSPDGGVASNDERAHDVAQMSL